MGGVGTLTWGILFIVKKKGLFVSRSMFKIQYSLLRHDGRMDRCIRCWRRVLEIGRGRVGVRGGIGIGLISYLRLR